MPCVKKYRGRWVADFYDQDRRRRIEAPQGHFKSKALERKAARTLLDARLAEVERGSYQSTRERPTFEKVCADYLESKVNLRPTTLRGYKSLVDIYLGPYFGERKANAITPRDIERFRSELAIGLPLQIRRAFLERIERSGKKFSEGRARQRVSRQKPGIRTINKCLTLMTMILNYAQRHGYVERNAGALTEKLRDTRVTDQQVQDGNILTPAEIRRLVDAASGPRFAEDGSTVGNNYRLLLAIAVFTGMRSGEILGCQWDDVDWASGQIHVRRALREGKFQLPKTATSIRRVEVPDHLLMELKKWKLRCPRGEHNLIFPNTDGKPMGHANLLQRGFYPALRRAGLRKIRFHDLRHTFASLMLANGEDIVRVSRMLGHASPAITLNVYSHMLPKEHYGGGNRLTALVYGESGSKPANAAASRPGSQAHLSSPQEAISSRQAQGDQLGHRRERA